MSGTAAATATLGGLGAVSASAEKCEPAEIENFFHDEYIVPLPVAPPGTFNYPTEPFRFSEYESAFDESLSASCYDDYRLDIVLTWNPTDDGPTNMGINVEEESSDGWTKIANERRSAGELENRLEISVSGVEPFVQYRYRPYAVAGAGDWEIETAAVAYSTESEE